MLKDIMLQDGDSNFLVRVAGINHHDDKILLHKKENDDFWNLIGGKVQMGESTTDALTREFFEETSVKIKVNNLIAVIENIYSLDDKNFHELLFVYNISLTESCKLSAEEEIILKWFEKSALKNEVFYPSIIKNIIFEKNSSQTVQHYINIE